MTRMVPLQSLVALPAAWLLLGTAPAAAQMYAPGSGDALDPEALYEVCAFCHGPEGQGSERLDAPALAGMEAWYVERQLHNFRDRTRGMHPEDLTGLQMSIVTGMIRNDATIRALAGYIAAMEPGAGLETLNGEPATTGRPYVWHSDYAEFTSPEPGDAERGARAYITCGVCHGPNGEGNEALAAPKLTDIQDWYQARQLRYFKDGIRGRSRGDIYGAQMAAMSMTLTDQTIADLLAYIDTL
ncbi:MAG: c-type cytochrome [Rhodospirillaceae bacterium]|nr:c-type cytochrome [Rhodospirillaceae bacterium]